MGTLVEKLNELCKARATLSMDVLERKKDPYDVEVEAMTLFDRDIGWLLEKLDAQYKAEVLTVAYGGKQGKSPCGITVFFPVGTDCMAIRRATEKAITKPWLEGCNYSYEQKGDSLETMGHHPHVHIFSPKSKTKSHMLREIYSTYKDLVASENSVDIRFQPASWFDASKKYLRGVKAGDKMNSVKFDWIWREQNGLPHPDQTVN